MDLECPECGARKDQKIGVRWPYCDPSDRNPVSITCGKCGHDYTVYD